MKCVICGKAATWGRFCSKTCCGLHRRIPLEKRLAAKIRRGSAEECWPWTGARTPDGYGSIGRGAPQHGTMLAHRAVWLVAHGELPEVEVCHSCDNPPCCNPAHLFVGTHADNMRDSRVKGRMRGAVGERNGGNKYPLELIQRVRELGPTMSQMRISKETGISQAQISRILRGESWSSL